MQFTLLAVSAFAASAFAAPQASASTTEDYVSLLSVLQTALPSSLIQEALTNSAAAVSEIASQFSNSQTPTWFTALPTDVQSYLLQTPTLTGSAVANITAAPNATAITTSLGNSTAIAGNQSSIIASIQSQNSSVLSQASAATASSGAGSTTGSSGSSATAGGASATGSSGSSSSSSAGASMPTALYGMGLAGAVGMVGLFAL